MAADRSDRGPETAEPEAPRAEEWLKRLADDLGEPPVSPREMGQVLKLAREVAHAVERKLAPPAAFLAGVYAGRRAGEGASREEALAEAVRAGFGLLPDRPSDGPTGSAPATGE